jgi:non-ribosomal peptide synthetase component F
MQLELKSSTWPQSQVGPHAAQAPCLHELFEAQADARGQATALVCGELALSYAELEAQANRLAHYLRAAGVEPGSFVGLVFERSELPIVAILAVLKAGGAYVPLEPGYPDERMRFIAGEAGIEVTLTQMQLQERAQRVLGGLVIALEDPAHSIAAQPARRPTRLETGLVPSDVCYVLYTSGTTGRPKGVVAEHRNVTHFVAAFNNVLNDRRRPHLPGLRAGLRRLHRGDLDGLLQRGHWWWAGRTPRSSATTWRATCGKPGSAISRPCRRCSRP